MASRSRQNHPRVDPDATTCTIHYIQRELGQTAMSVPRMVVYLRALIGQHGFPRPLPTLLRAGQITTDVHPRSAWVRTAVDAWLAGFIPPDCAATIDAAAHRAASTEMDAAAQNLRLVGGRDYAGGRA